MKEAEELEKREEYLENIGDVRKQQDLSGFYRHLYSQKLGDESTSKTEPTESSKPETSENKSLDKKKNYRKRKASDDEEEKAEDDSENKTDHLQSNLDADSDFSIESSDSEDEKKKVEEVPIKKEKSATPPPAKNGDDFKEPELPVKEEIKEESPPPKVKIDIWKKRTVDEVFDQALKRYFERKALREQAA